MFYLILIFILLMIVCIVFKVKIKWKTFLKRGFLPRRGDWGVYCYEGDQGKGKTYSLVEYLLDNKDTCEIFCNIADIRHIDYTYFTGFKGLIEIKKALDDDTLVYDKTKQLVIVYDEIFTELQKHSKLNKEIIDFLCQMRKRKIIFLTTAQVWEEVPLTFRRFCRYQIQCNMYNLGIIGILHKRFRDAENMKWSNEDQEHIAPLISNTITKTRKYVANAYNTHQRIKSEGDASPSTAIAEHSCQ